MTVSTSETFTLEAKARYVLAEYNFITYKEYSNNNKENNNKFSERGFNKVK